MELQKMHSHTLTSADEWFLKKNLKDSLSRTTFGLGDTVIVCDHRHVMLAEFYDGECPTCHSRNTVPFSRPNIEQGKLHSYSGNCPECSSETVIMFHQYDAGSSYIGKCPKCGKDITVNELFFTAQNYLQLFRKYFSISRIVLAWILGLLIVCVIVLTAAGIIPNDALVVYAQNTILPRSRLLFKSFAKENVFLTAIRKMSSESTVFMENTSVFFLMLIDSAKTCGLSFWNKTYTIMCGSGRLLSLFAGRTQALCQLIGGFIKQVLSYFA